MLAVPSSYDERTIKLKRMVMTDLIKEVVFTFSHEYCCMLRSETLGIRSTFEGRPSKHNLASELNPGTGVTRDLSDISNYAPSGEHHLLQ